MLQQIQAIEMLWSEKPMKIWKNKNAQQHLLNKDLIDGCLYYQHEPMDNKQKKGHTKRRLPPLPAQKGKFHVTILYGYNKSLLHPASQPQLAFECNVIDATWLHI